jgi:hypothetical protein
MLDVAPPSSGLPCPTNSLRTGAFAPRRQDGSAGVGAASWTDETTAGPYGELAVENDDQRMLVYFEDRSAHERVTRAAKDAAARRESGRFRTSPQHALLTKVTDHKPSEA